MTLRRKAVLVVLCILEIFLLGLGATGMRPRRQAELDAWGAYRRDPFNVTKQQLWQQEKERSLREWRITTFSLYSMAGLNAVLIVVVARRSENEKIESL